MPFKRFCILWLIALPALCGQAKNIDSLRLLLECQPNKLNSDEAMVVNQQLGEYYLQQHDYARALVYFENALHLCSQRADKIIQLKNLGKTCVDSTHYQLGIYYLKQAADLNQSDNAHPATGEIYNLTGMCYGLTNNLDSAIIAFGQGLKYYQQVHDSGSLAFSYYNTGLAYYFKGAYEHAVKNYITSAEIRESIKDTNNLVTSLTSIGEVFRIKDDYQKAKSYYSKAIGYSKNLDNNEVRAYIYSELALINKDAGIFDTALLYIDTALYYSHKAKYKRGVTTLTSYKASIASKQGNHDKARRLYLEAIDGYREINFDIGLVQSYLALAEIAYQQKNYQQALVYIQKALPKAKGNYLLEETTGLTELKYKIYKAIGQTGKALAEAETFIRLKDSLLNTQKESIISELETRYETQQKEKQIELLDKENKIIQQQVRQRTFLSISIGMAAVLAVVILLMVYRQSKLKSQLQIEQNRQKLLRSQMNPHFIYNALAAIQNYILTNNPIDSATYMAEFSGLMRLVLEGSRNDIIPLEKDIQLVNSYLSLQKLRFNNAFTYNVEVDEKLNAEWVKIPPMLSQPFIENAVEHGMRRLTNGEGRIRVVYSDKDTAVQIRILDNGPGIVNLAGKTDQQHTSLATKITRERIESFRKTHKIGITMEITSHAPNTGVQITFSIPKITQP